MNLISLFNYLNEVTQEMWNSAKHGYKTGYCD